MAVSQTITISKVGGVNEDISIYTTEALLTFLHNAIDSGKMTNDRTYSGDTMTITRTWTDEGWSEYQSYVDSTTHDNLVAAGYTVTNTNDA